MRVGYYSLIQYCPDPAKLEAASVGVALFDQETLQFEFKTAGVRRVHSLFGRSQIGADQFTDLMSSFEVRLKRAGKAFLTPKDIEEFAATLAGEIVMTPLRLVAVDVFETRLVDLATKLIGWDKRPAAAPDARGVRSRLTAEFKKPAYRRLVQQHVRVALPSFDQKLIMPYGYQNGRYNFIKPVNFASPGKVTLLEKTGIITLKAEELFAATDPRGPMQLVVVADFKPSQESVKRHVQMRLEKAHAKFYTSESLPLLLAEIRDHARPLDEVAEVSPGLFRGDSAT